MVEAIHDFSSKLLQPKALTLLQRYVVWQAAMRQSSTPEKVLMPEMAPISINLDPTSACNFRCDHCVDEEILNTGKQYHFGKLQESLDLMHERGLQSVIIIGGGEPTLYKQFGNLVTFLKEREIQIGIVSNGTRLEKVLEVAQHFTEGDWLRLSLDSGTEETFQQPIS